MDSVDVWKKELEELESDIRKLLYPPCFSVSAIPKNSNTDKSGLLVFRFKTKDESEQLMRLPLYQLRPVPVIKGMACICAHISS